MLKQRIKTSLIFVSFFLLQYNFFPYFRYQNSIPDLLAVLVVYHAFYLKKNKFLVFVFLVGLFRDLFSTYFFGFETLSYLISGYLVFVFIKRFSPDLLVFRILSVFLFSLLTKTLLFFFLTVSSFPFDFIEMFWVRVFPSVIFTTFLSPFLLIILRKILKESLRQYRLF